MKDHPLQQANLYLRWNLALLDAFFSPAAATEEVWLQTSAETLDEIGPHLGGDQGLQDALRDGPPWLLDFYKGPSKFADAAILLTKQRVNPHLRPRGYIAPDDVSSAYYNKNAPTYLPYLAALARTAASSEDSFYRTLQRDFGLPEEWNWQQLSRFSTVWEDLEHWSNSCQGQFGYFKVRTLGGYAHIGLARSQVVMAPKDTRLINGVFAQVGLRVGQALDNEKLREIRLTAIGTSYPLSAAFRIALDSPEYTDLIDERLKVLFGEWDGNVPERAKQARAFDGAPPIAERPEVTLCLSYQDADPSRWCIHWQFPFQDDAQAVELEGAGFKWNAKQLDSSDGMTYDDNNSLSQAAARECLARSAFADVDFISRTQGEDGATQEYLVLRKSPLRILAFRRNDAHWRDEYREHPVRPHGAVVLLASPENASGLLSYLERESLEYDRLLSDGLPDGWLLVLLHDCSKLNETTLQTLPDGRDRRTIPSMLRLVGGRSVNRGGGRQYLAYDLPILEIDAPEGTHLDAPGLLLVPEDGQVSAPTRVALHAPGQVNSTKVTAARQFRIELDTETSLRNFLITARKGQYDQSIRLRVASDSGEYVASSGKFSIAPTGAPQENGSGMRGVITGRRFELVDQFDVTERDIGSPLSANDTSDLKKFVAIEFLDSLAQCVNGSMSYGTARDQLSRLLRRVDGRTTPVEILLALRTRGHIEIETNARGHLTRIHSIEPALHRLTTRVEGLQAFGVMGTLRIRHWQTLAAAADRYFVYLESRHAWEAPCLRLVLGNIDEATRFASGMGLVTHEQPSKELAAWSAGLSEMVADVERNTVLGWGAQTNYIERLNSNNLRYFPDRSGMAIAEGFSRQLMKTDDPATGQHKIYLLGMRSEDQASRYGFVRDSRWGTWIAISAFADFARSKYGIADACPWPLPYGENDGTIWIPARAGLPVTLERALVLCSGDGPHVVDVTDAAPDGDDGWVLIHAETHLARPRVSNVYQAMLKGRWLLYRWVPREIAEVIALKLRAALRPA